MARIWRGRAVVLIENYSHLVGFWSGFLRGGLDS